MWFEFIIFISNIPIGFICFQLFFEILQIETDDLSPKMSLPWGNNFRSVMFANFDSVFAGKWVTGSFGNGENSFSRNIPHFFLHRIHHLRRPQYLCFQFIYFSDCFQTFHNTEASLSTLAALEVLLTTIRFSQSNFKRIEETILEFDWIINHSLLRKVRIIWMSYIFMIRILGSQRPFVQMEFVQNKKKDALTSIDFDILCP